MVRAYFMKSFRERGMIKKMGVSDYSAERGD